MGIGALKSLIRPLSRTLSSRITVIPNLTPSPAASSFLPNSLSPEKAQSRLIVRSVHLESLSSLAPKPFDPLTDTRFPKRRPSDRPRRKRASLRPPGPYAWVKYVPGQPVLPNQPNEGSVKLRNEKKRRRQRREFILAEAKKRKAQLQAAKRKKREKQIERKMAAVAREREWSQRLAELQRLEEEKSST
ncbi:hypothetical protein Ancab_017503 [Ancistrocladus abbreviatus]